MTLPASIANELLRKYAELIDDRSVDVDQITLKRILKECKAAIQTAPTRADIARLYTLLGSTHMRREESGEALAAFVNADRFDSSSASSANNVATAYVASGRLDEAREWIEKAIERAKEKNDLPVLFFALCNQSSLCNRLGHADAARQLLDKAIRIAIPTNRFHQWMLAELSALLGRDHDSVEFAARFLSIVSGSDLGQASAVEFIKSVSAEHRERLKLASAFGDAFARVLAEDDSDESVAASVPALIELSKEGWEQVMAATEAPPSPTSELLRLLNETSS